MATARDVWAAKQQPQIVRAILCARDADMIESNTSEERCVPFCVLTCTSARRAPLARRARPANPMRSSNSNAATYPPSTRAGVAGACPASPPARSAQCAALMCNRWKLIADRKTASLGVSPSPERSKDLCSSLRGFDMLLTLTTNILLCKGLLILPTAAASSYLEDPPKLVYLPLVGRNFYTGDPPLLISALYYDTYLNGESDEAFQVYNPLLAPVPLVAGRSQPRPQPAAARSHSRQESLMTETPSSGAPGRRRIFA